MAAFLLGVVGSVLLGGSANNVSFFATGEQHYSAGAAAFNILLAVGLFGAVCVAVSRARRQRTATLISGLVGVGVGLLFVVGAVVVLLSG